jgi:tRNA A37 threonylcarbamoyladenosine modification protein TsaB
VPALDAAAYPYQTAGRKVWAILESGRGRIGVACYDWVGGEWTQIVAPTLTTWQGLRTLAREPAIFTGEIDDPALLGEAAAVPAPALRLRRAACLAELAALRLARNDVDDIATLAPLYLQHPAVEA